MARRRGVDFDQVMRDSRYFLNSFVRDMSLQDGVDQNAEAMQALDVEAPSDLPPEHIREIKRTIGDIRQAMEEDNEFQAKLSKIPPDMNEDVTKQVAKNLFGSSAISWGTIVAFFYFAYRVCKKVLNVIDLLRSLMQSLFEFMRDRFVNWIAEQGGWNGIFEQGEFWNWVSFGTAAAATAATGFMIYKHVL